MDARQQISRLLAEHEVILLTSHIRLDGDAVGSELALWHALDKMGKRAHVVNDSEIPDIYKFLPGSESAGTCASMVPGDCDLVVVVDSPAIVRLGEVAERLPKGAPVINIDHHTGNENFGSVNWVDLSVTAVGEMIYDIIAEMGVEVDEAIAQAVATAILTDTGRFMHGNTTPRGMRIVAELMERGFDIARVIREVYCSFDPAVVKLRGMAAAGIELLDDGRIACMRLTREMFRRTGAKPINTQDFVDVPRSIKGVSVAVLLVEMEGDRVKVSLRSNGALDVGRLVRRFGGGGHRAAAGCEMTGTLDEVQKTITSAIEAEMAQCRSDAQ